MKQIFLMTAAILLSISCSGQKSEFTLKGQLDKDVNDTKYYIYMTDADGKLTQDPIDSVEVKKGKFTYKANIDGPRLMLLRGKVDEHTISMNTQSFYATPGEKAEISIKAGEYFLNGTTFYKQWNEADKAHSQAYRVIIDIVDKARQLEKKPDMTDAEKMTILEQLQNDFEKAHIDLQNADSTFLSANANQPGVVAFMLHNSQNVEMVERLMGNEVRTSDIGKIVEKQAKLARQQREQQEAAEKQAKAAEGKSAEGNMFVDFEAEYEGKVTKLSDYVGKGKYVLVDFWASWCGPCKAEIPNLIEVYNKYKGDKFMVLGVATWDKPAATLKAIEKLGIPYPQMLNAQNAGSDAYGIMGIPQIILFGPDGTILKRDLRGSQIEKVVSQYITK